MNLDFVCRFIDSWRRSSVPKFNVTFEEFVAYKPQTILNIMEYCELAIPSLHEIDELFSSGATSRRFNSGKINRANELSPESQALIEKFKKMYQV